MKIKSIRIANFKSFRDCTIELNDFNVIIGANASGKSNFVQIFKFLKDLKQYGLENAISLQGGGEYLCNSNLSSNKRIVLEILIDDIDQLQSVVNINSKNIALTLNEATYKIAIEFSDDKTRIKQINEDSLILKYWISELVPDIGIKDAGMRFKPSILDRGKIILRNSPEGLKEELSFPEQYSELTNHIKNRNPTLTYLVNLLSEPLPGFRPILEQLKSYTLLPNTSTNQLILQTSVWDAYLIVKDFSESISIFDFEPKLSKNATQITGKLNLDEDGKNLAIVLGKLLEDDENKRKLINIIRDILPFVSDLNVEKFADKSLIVRAKEIYNKTHYLPAFLMSDGTINIIALVIALYFDKAALAIIEEPERNIHPHLISRVVEMMKEASQNKQIIVTTHNPEIVKYADLKDIILISRQDDGFSCG
jgi:predicted ATPase